MTHQEIKELAGHRAVSPWVMKLVGDALDKETKKVKTMNEEERNAMREHIVWLTLQLEKTRKQVKLRDELLKEMLNPDELGHAVTQEIRGRIYNILYLQEKE